MLVLAFRIALILDVKLHGLVFRWLFVSTNSITMLVLNCHVLLKVRMIICFVTILGLVLTASESFAMSTQEVRVAPGERGK